jgi:hypothetical protein
LLFGITPSRCSWYTTNLEILVLRKLKNHWKARISWPKSISEKKRLAALITRREPRVKDVIGFTDGVSLPIKCASDPISQATNFNGYHSDTMCNNVLWFTPSGIYKIIYACINYPGS